MRLLILAFMIVLLPLRGWMGDAMATEMVLAQLQPTQYAPKTIASNNDGTNTGAHFHHESGANVTAQEAPFSHDCAEPASDDASQTKNAYCESCSACQVCHMLVLTPVTADLNALFSAGTRQHAASTPFASAEAVLDQKPPIF